MARKLLRVPVLSAFFVAITCLPSYGCSQSSLGLPGTWPTLLRYAHAEYLETDHFPSSYTDFNEIAGGDFGRYNEDEKFDHSVVSDKQSITFLAQVKSNLPKSEKVGFFRGEPNFFERLVIILGFGYPCQTYTGAQPLFSYAAMLYVPPETDDSAAQTIICHAVNQGDIASPQVIDGKLTCGKNSADISDSLYKELTLSY